MADDEHQGAATAAAADTVVALESEPLPHKNGTMDNAAATDTNDNDASSSVPPPSQSSPPRSTTTDDKQPPFIESHAPHPHSDALEAHSAAARNNSNHTDASSNSSSNTNDLVAQLRALKERSSRMEVLLAKRSAKITEMDETEAKLKRLLAMAKRSIDNSKHELAAKDAALDSLHHQIAHQTASYTSHVTPATRAPKRIILKVAYNKTLWCLVEYESLRDAFEDQDDDDDADDEAHAALAWHCFATQDELQAYANRASGEPLVLPELSLTPFESERARKDVHDEMERVQEEFRRYRVRAEITRKQKDAELRKMSASAVARQTEQIAETDVSSELQTARLQIRRLTKTHTETEERELEWRRKYDKLLRDYEKLSGTMGETVLATEWRERYEHVVREKDELEKKVDELRALAHANGTGLNGALASYSNSSGTTNGSDIQVLRHEFAQYRKRALNAVEQKEKELNDIHAHLHEASSLSRTGSRTTGLSSTASLRRMSSESCGSLSGFEPPPNATTTNEYLKNIVYKYMTSDQDEGKQHMETAIATVLNFTTAEVTAVQEKRKQAQGWFW